MSTASLAAASLWATGLPEEGYLLDAEMWQEEVAGADHTHWPTDGWYRLAPQGRGVEVAAAQKAQPVAPAAGALYFRLPGTQLKQGLPDAQPQQPDHLREVAERLSVLRAKLLTLRGELGPAARKGASAD